MRILMLSPYPSVKGPIPKHTPLLVAALREQGCEVITEHWGRHTDSESLVDKVFGRIQDILRIRCRLTGRAFDIVVLKTSHDWATLSRDIPLLLVIRRLCCRIVLQFHGSQSDALLQPGHVLFKQTSTLLLRLADAVLVLSSQEQRQWQAFAPWRQVCVVSNPFAPSDGRLSIQFKDTLRLPTDRPLLLFVGRLIAEKGVLELLDAVASLLKERVCQLVVAGDGPQKQRLGDRARYLGISNHVSFVGHLASEQLAQAYGAADVFVLPTYSEGFPTVIAEAMHAGLPIVTTPVGGAADHLGDGINALFVPPRDDDALADALIRILDDQDLRTRMGQANKEKVQEFAPDIVARQYLGVLHKISCSEIVCSSRAHQV